MPSIVVDAPPDRTALLLRGRLPDGFERWTLTMAAGTERPTDAAEWAGAIVLIEKGSVDVGCLAGGHRTFVAGDLLALGWLPLKWIRNPGPGEASLVAVRRRGARPVDNDLRVERHSELGSDR